MPHTSANLARTAIAAARATDPRLVLTTCLRRVGPCMALLLCVTVHAQATPQQPDALAPIRTDIQQNHLAQAEADLRHLLATAPSASAGSLLGYALYRDHDYTGSLAAYTAAARLAQPSPADLLIVASDYIQLKSYPDAARWLTWVTEHDPTNLTAWYLLGRTDYLQDHNAEALAAFQHCLLLDPRNLRAQYNSGLALEHMQRPDDAEQAYRIAIAWQSQTPSNDPQPSLNLGTLLLTQGKVAEAVQRLATATAQAPANPLCWQQLGRAQQAIGDTGSAIASFRRATTLTPLSQQAHFFLARALRQAGDNAAGAAEFAIVDRLQSTRSGVDTPNPDTP